MESINFLEIKIKSYIIKKVGFLGYAMELFEFYRKQETYHTKKKFN